MSQKGRCRPYGTGSIHVKSSGPEPLKSQEWVPLSLRIDPGARPLVAKNGAKTKPTHAKNTDLTPQKLRFVEWLFTDERIPRTQGQLAEELGAKKSADLTKLDTPDSTKSDTLYFFLATR